MPHFVSERVGGVEIQTFLIAKYLFARGWDVHFIAATHHHEKIDAEEMYEGIHIHWIMKRGLFSFFRRDIIAKLKQIAPHVIYQRGRSLFTSSPSAVVYARKHSKKLVYHCAENSDTMKNFNLKQVWHSDKFFIKKWILGIHAALADLFFIRTIKYSHLIIVQTHRQASQFGSVFHRDTHLVRSSHEIPQPPFDKPAPKVVFWIAHAGRRKRPELFVELAGKLANETAVFIMAGTLPHEDLRQEIFSAMKGLTNIEYIGPLNWQQANSMFAKASVFINTTLPDREGFPNTYLQAWMHETPVVTLDCDPDDIIEKNHLGFHSVTFDKLVEHVRLLLHDENLRVTLGHNARRYAMENHSMEKSADAMNDLLLKLIS